ncbi:MAG TPA: GxxExxY protein [Phycisphaerales bacterium]|nr:GxxExxY protein [Phycisphaerales bacterium]
MQGDYEQGRGGGGGRGYGGGGGGRGYGRGGTGGGGYGGHGGGGHERRGIPLSALDAATTEASRKVIGAAIEVHKLLGPGFAQDVYLGALKQELDALGVSYKADHRVPVTYKDKRVGEGTVTMFVDNRFFLGVMARPGQVSTFERLQLRAMLKAADLELGLIINFAERRLKDGLVRVVNVDKIVKERGIQLEGDGHEDDGGGMHEFENQ